jgi:hypothetical protein
MCIATRILLCCCVVWIVWAHGEQQMPAKERTEALINQLGTGDIRQEDAAKLELMTHPRPQAVPILLQALPRSEITVQYKILDILQAYKDRQKITPLLEFIAPPNFRPDFAEKIGPQLVELGPLAGDALISSLPNQCKDDQGQQYATWVGTTLERMGMDGTGALLDALSRGGQCRLCAARQGLIVPRPGPPMAPPATSEDVVQEAGRNLLVDAAEDRDPKIRALPCNGLTPCEGGTGRSWTMPNFWNPWPQPTVRR